MVPLQCIPPIIIAAVARQSSVSAEDLAAMQCKVLLLLSAADIHVVSQSADGTETERATQCHIAAGAASRQCYTIPNPKLDACTVSITALLYDRHPCVMVQDSKHAAKTGRNQISSGA